MTRIGRTEPTPLFYLWIPEKKLMFSRGSRPYRVWLLKNAEKKRQGLPGVFSFEAYYEQKSLTFLPGHFVELRLGITKTSIPPPTLPGFSDSTSTSPPRLSPHTFRSSASPPTLPSYSGRSLKITTNTSTFLRPLPHHHHQHFIKANGESSTSPPILPPRRRYIPQDHHLDFPKETQKASTSPPTLLQRYTHVLSIATDPTYAILIVYLPQK